MVGSGLVLGLGVGTYPGGGGFDFLGFGTAGSSWMGGVFGAWFGAGCGGSDCVGASLGGVVALAVGASRLWCCESSALV